MVRHGRVRADGMTVAKPEDKFDPAAAHIAALFSDNLGAGCGLAFTGAYMGELTQSLGVAKIEAGRLTLGLDIRHPNDISPEEVLSRLNGAVKAACGGRILKVILECCLLTEAEKIRLCGIVTRPLTWMA